MHLLESDQSMQGNQRRNQMTIKEHYKNILNERLFNPNNPIGKIETGIRKLGQLINPTEHKRKEREVAYRRADARDASAHRNAMARESGGRVPSRADVEARVERNRIPQWRGTRH